MKKMIFAAVFLVSSVGYTGGAVKRTDAKHGSYGMAGCGLGAVLFKDKRDTVSQILAATTNGTSGNQTFGISTGTLECTDDGTMSVTRAKEVFTEANQDKIVMDMAKGNGEYLAAFSSFYGCVGQDKVSAFGKMTKDNFDVISQQVDHKNLIKAVDEVFATNQVSGLCGA